MVTITAQVAKLATQFAGVILLSRVLTPADFGLVAMVAVVLSLGDLLRDFGLPTAALQASSLSRKQAGNLFWLNTLLGALATVVVIAGTPLLVELYSAPPLLVLTPVLSITLLLNGMQAQLQVQLARRRHFLTLALTDITAPIMGLLAAMAAAFSGLGYWALAIQALVVSCALLTSRAALLRWNPGLPRRGSNIAPILRSGLHLGLAQLVGYAAGNADSVVIGVRFTPSALGLYNRAFQLMVIPISGLLAPLTNVVIPTMQRARARGQSVPVLMLRLQFTAGIATVPLFVLAIVAAPFLIPALLGQQWQGSVLLFQILAAGALFQVFSYVSYWTFLIEGLTGSLLRYNLLTKSLAIVLIVAGSFFGIVGVAIGYALGLVIAWPINLIWLHAVADQAFGRFFGQGLRLILPGLAGVITGLAIYPILSSWPGGVASALAALAALVVFGALVLIFPTGRRDCRSTMALIRGSSFVRRSAE